MEPIRINPDEFKLENFINYYNDNVEELLSKSIIFEILSINPL